MVNFNPKENINGISHLNVVVSDIEQATAFYGDVLGFEMAHNDGGAMDYPGVDLASFARDAGFMDGKVDVDVRFLRHPRVGVFLELMKYRLPAGDGDIVDKLPNALGGIRHIALNVHDAVQAHQHILSKQAEYAQKGLKLIIRSGEHEREELTPFPYKFFYWVDPWGVQWEMEEGRQTDCVIRGVTGLSYLALSFVRF